MRVLFVTDGDRDDPSARCRAYGWVDPLAAEGVLAHVLPPAARTGARGKLRLLREAAAADVVVLQRVLPPPAALALLAAANPRLAFDFDDALYLTPSVRDRLPGVMARAGVVIAGSEELARHARPLTRRVVVIPTVVDPRGYAETDTPTVGPRLTGSDAPAKAPAIGWIGTAENLDFLEVARPALVDLRRRGVKFTLHVISSRTPAWPEPAVDFIPWSRQGAFRELSRLDIGLAPLPDTPWTRGKCGLKAIEYMAAGLPVVASPVGALAEIVVDGRTGFLAGDTAAWVHGLQRLMASEDLRRQLGEAGRRRVGSHLSTQAMAPSLARELARAAFTRPPRSSAWVSHIAARSKHSR